MKSRLTKRGTAIVLAMLIILTALAGLFVPAEAATGRNRTLKVGFFAYPGYHEMEDGVKSGYGYDFLTLLSEYTRLNFEYVGYEKSWEEMQQMLLNGEIDLLTSARKTQEREEIFDFSEPIGTNKAQINVRATDERYLPGDYASLNGATIGILSGNSRNEDLEAFALEKGFTYYVKEYADAEELEKALQTKQVDAIATSSLRKSKGEMTVAEFAPQDFFCIVKKGNTDIIEEVNYGISQMDLFEGNWRDNFFYSNYTEHESGVLSFSSREKTYIKNVQEGKKIITVTAQPGVMPYSYFESGSARGILPDYFTHLMNMAELPYSFEVPKEGEDFLTWAESKHIDVVLDVTDLAKAEELQSFGFLTDPIMDLFVSKVTRKEYVGDPKKIAGVKGWKLSDLHDGKIGEYSILEVTSGEEALQAVSSKKADGCYVYSYLAEAYINSKVDTDLYATVLSTPVGALQFLISEDSDHEICSILNKCIRVDSSNALDTVINKYTQVTPQNLGFSQYLKYHPWLIVFLTLMLVLLLVIIAAFFIRSKNVKAKSEQLKRELAQQQKLEESLAFTNYFLGTYLSAYYVNMDTLACRVYKRTEKMEKEYPVITNYYESLSEYIERSVHPDDRAEMYALVKPTRMKAILEKEPECTYIFRDISNSTEKTYRMQIIRGADRAHAAFGFIDITEELAEQQKHMLGAVPLSGDILMKANIGLWAFELDEGKAPRMYVDEAMLGLIGLDHQVTPEETYHAWYDHIDPAAYDMVKEAVGKMSRGEHAEVQYPWHHPNGETWMVRCGGVQNSQYKKGIRIEGTHQNVTEVLHYDEQEMTRLRATETQLKHEQLRSEVLNYMVDHSDDDPIELLKSFGERIRSLLNCDQVIYRDLEETRIMVNSNAIEDTWAVPESYCRQCQHFDAHHPMYHLGYTEMDNCQEGWEGIPVYEKCPIKSSLTRLVFCDGEIAGYLAVHYVQEYHQWTDLERATMEEFTRILSISLSRYEAKKTNKELRLLQEYQQELQKNMEIIQALAQDYSSVYYIDVDKETVTPYSMNEETALGMSETFESNDRFPVAFQAYVDRFVYEPDREMMIREAKKANVLQKLSEKNSYSITYRGLNEGKVVFCEMKYVVAHEENGVIKSVALGFAYKDREIMAQYINEKLAAEYISAFMVDLDHDKYRIYRHPETTSAMDREDRIWSLGMAEFAKECDPEYCELVKNIGDPAFLKEELALVDRREYLYRSPSTSKPWRRAVVQILDRKDGVPSNVLATFMAIDDYQSKIKDQQKQLEAQQKQLEDALSMAESANRAKTTFLNNMSHDIRTPMNAIIGYTGLAASHIDNKEQVQDYLRKIGQSSDHLLSLINDVLDMSRIESGKMNIEDHEENLPDIIHTLRDIVSADIRAKQHDFYIDTVNVTDEDIICDKLRLNQVLLNILSNAIKYTAPGGTISMRITEKTVKPSGYATYEFCIKDNGMGMDKTFLDTIFDPFTRVRSSTVSGIQGTGLGMAITKNIVDMMGGVVSVESEPGKGTTVSVTFDFKLAVSHSETVKIAELEGMRGLVVDDDSNTCISISNMLEDVGMRADWCTFGKEAVIRAEDAYKKGNPFRVFIIDWLMPDMNGIETTRRIRKAIGDDTPIVILTAYDWTDIEEEAREAGVTAFVSKPLFPSDLQRVLNTCLGKPEEAQTAPQTDYDFRGKKVLLVEDNELNREIATELLSEYGFIVDTADDGMIAVAKMSAASAGDYDIVLMDVQMPTMDGYEATRLIRAMGTEISKIPILAMTANAFEEDRKAAIEAGMNEHIAKPIDIEKLKATLAKFL